MTFSTDARDPHELLATALDEARLGLAEGGIPIGAFGMTEEVAAMVEGAEVDDTGGIGGTLANPRFMLKSLGSKNQMNAIQGLLGGQQSTQAGQTQQQPSDLVQGITGLFKKKKQP